MTQPLEQDEQMDVFMSYGRNDRAKAVTIAELLEQCGWSVWWDRDLSSGEKWEPAVLNTIRAAKCVIVIWTRDSIRRNWVQREAHEARAEGTLVPVLMQPASLPTPTDDVQGVRLSTWSGEEKSEALIPLLEAVKRKVGHGSIPTDLNAGERLQRAMTRLTAAEVAEAVFDYCAAAIEWERLRQGGHSFRDEDHQPKRRAYQRIESFFKGSDSELDDEDLHEMVSRFLDALYPDYENQGTNGAPRLT